MSELRLDVRMQLNRRPSLGRSPTTRVAALHEIDFEAVLGEVVAADWVCRRCSSRPGGVPAAFVKRADSLDPLCLRCLGQVGEP